MYYIEYLKYKMFICIEGIFYYINLLHSKFYGKYVFLQLTCLKGNLYNAIKIIVDLKNNTDTLHNIMVKFYGEVAKNFNENNEFSCLILNNCEREKIIGDISYMGMYVCVSDSYCDTFADSIDRGILNNKLPIVYYMF